MAQQDLAFVTLIQVPTLAMCYEAVHYDPYYQLETETLHPIALAAKASDPDTMYLHQAHKEPDREHFIQAMLDEVNDHVTRGHWEFVRKEDVLWGGGLKSYPWFGP